MLEYVVTILYCAWSIKGSLLVIRELHAWPAGLLLAGLSRRVQVDRVAGDRDREQELGRRQGHEPEVAPASDLFAARN